MAATCPSRGASPRAKRRPARLVVVGAGLVIVALVPVTGSQAAFTAKTTNADTFTAHPDWRPPVTTRATLVKTTAGVPVGHPGYVRSGGTYRFISDTVDDPSSNPAAGVGTVTGAVPDVAVAAAMPAAALTVASLTYTRASMVLIAPVAFPGLNSTGAMTLTANDTAVPVNTAAPFGSTVILDNTALTATALGITNGGGTTRAAGRRRRPHLHLERRRRLVRRADRLVGRGGEPGDGDHHQQRQQRHADRHGHEPRLSGVGRQLRHGEHHVYRLPDDVAARHPAGRARGAGHPVGRRDHGRAVAYTWTPSNAVTDRGGNASSTGNVAEGGVNDPNF